jgi:hypothetical protein
MAYANATAEQKAVIDSYTTDIRALLGEAARLVRRAQLAKKQLNEIITPIVTSWDSDDAWPNKSGLAGASPSVTKSDILNWQGYLDAVVTAIGSDAHLGQMVAAAGPENCRG